MINRAFLIVLTWGVLAFQVANAQDKFMSGFYVNENGDTVRGFIRVRTNYEPDLIFRPSSRADSDTVSISNISSFGFDNWTKYQRLTITQNSTTKVTVFAKVLAEGDVDLFRYYKNYILHHDSRGTFELASMRALNDAGAKKNYQQNVGTFNILFQDCKNVKDAAPRTRINEISLKKRLRDYHACKGAPMRTYEAKKVRTFGTYAGISASYISFSSDATYLTEPAYEPSVNPSAGLVLVKQPYKYSPLAFQTELGYSKAEYKASHYETYTAAGYEFENEYDVFIKFSSLFARFGMRFTVRSNFFNPYFSAGVQLGGSIDHGSFVTGTERVNSQVNDVSYPAPVPTPNGVWLALGGKKQFTDRISLAFDVPVSYGQMMVVAPRIILLF